MKLILLSFLLVSCNSELIDSKGLSVKVTKGQVAKKIRLTGFSQPLKSIKYLNQISTRVTDVHVKVGDRVSQGQLLISLDKSAWKDIERSYQFERKKLTSQLKVKAEKLSAITKKDNYLKSLPPFPGQKSALRKNFATIELLNEDISKIKNSISEVDLKIQNKEEIERLFSVTARHDGIVTHIPRGTKKGLISKKGEVLISTSEKKKMMVKVKVVENQVVDLKEGTSTKMNLVALRENVEGRIIKVKEVSEQKKDNQLNGYEVSFEFSPPERFKLGMRVEIDITPREKNQVDYLPHEALMRDEQGRYWVYKRNESDWSETIVDIGLIGTHRVEIRNGVREGDEILLTGKNAISI